MGKFMDENFLLTTRTAEILFFDYAQKSPIIDYHNHLNPEELFHRRRYKNLSELWLEADHYKWRAMRCNGIPEKLITGNASPKDKFLAYAKVMPDLIGSPVYHWTHMELQRYFDIAKPLSEDSAEEIWKTAERVLSDPVFDAEKLIEKMKVKLLCTTDEPFSNLMWHKKIKDEKPLSFQVLPGFRPDRLLHIDSDGWKKLLETHHIGDFHSLCSELKNCLDEFQNLGCKMADHGFIHFRYGRGDADSVLKKAGKGECLSEEEIAVYQGELLVFLGQEYEKRGMTMQLHLGPVRNTSARLMETFGTDAGGDSIGELTDPFLLAAFLGYLEKEGTLPKTILYGLNPGDNEMLATMAVNFCADGGRVSYGAAWWLQDHIRGVEEQLNLLMETGSLACSPGMLTDSRSVLSFVRHEYYRRILCRRLGELVEQGQYPNDLKYLGNIVERVCWRNAMKMFE